MSSIHPRICPIMSRMIQPPRSSTELLEAECLEERCAFWIKNEGICSYSFAAIMLSGIYDSLREEGTFREVGP